MIIYMLEEPQGRNMNDQIIASFRMDMPNGEVTTFKNPFPRDMEVGRVFEMMQRRAAMETEMYVGEKKP